VGEWKDNNNFGPVIFGHWFSLLVTFSASRAILNRLNNQIDLRKTR
jgi:hypothetical protein